MKTSTIRSDRESVQPTNVALDPPRRTHGVAANDAISKSRYIYLYTYI